jgi:hypothetical protein
MQRQAIRGAVFALLCSSPVAGLTAPAAHVTFATPGASAVKADGTQKLLKKGDPLEQGDTVATHGGRAQLHFSDGAFVSLQPDTVFRIDEYRFEGKADGSERGFFTLLKGGLRTITGLVGRTNRGNYQVTTQVATIGIRGTEYQLQHANSINGSVGEGEIRVCNGAGCLGVASGQSFFVMSPNDLPVLTAVRTSFPPPQPPPPKPRMEGGTETDEQLGIATEVLRAKQNREELTTGVGEVPGLGGPPPTVGEITRKERTALAYARDAGGDSPGLGKNNGTAWFDRQNQLVAYRAPGQLDIQARGVAESGVDSLIGWGRWDGAYIDSGKTIALQDNQGLHYVVGQPTSAPELNKGTASYNLLGATTPTGTDNLPGGKLDQANLWINFGSQRVDLDMQVTYGGRAYIVDTRSSARSAIGLNRGQASFVGQGLETGCQSKRCTTDVAGTVVGPKAERAGMTYSITDRMSSAIENEVTSQARAAETPGIHINGAAAFARSASPAPSTARD